MKLTTASYWRPSGKAIDRYDEISKQTKVWGIQPDPGFEIEISEEEVFENMRQRNLRDLRGLLTEEESEMVRRLRVYRPPSDDADASADEPSQAKDSAKETPGQEQEANEQDNQIDDAPKGPHVDKALKRAIEYLESLVKKSKQIAA